MTALDGAVGAGVIRCRELARLVSLRDQAGWVFRPIHRDGELVLLAGVLVWPRGWSDAIAIRHRGDARAVRCEPVGGEVWSREGSLLDVLDAVAELPAPNQPGAPRLVVATGSALWRPTW